MSRTPEQRRRTGLMIVAYGAMLASVPTVLEPGEHGPLNADEVARASALMDQWAAESVAERNGGPAEKPAP